VSPDLDRDSVTTWLDSAASGDRQAREKLIEHYRPFILNEAQRVCRRSLKWGSDDELSVALIAFNEAIDAYRKSEGSFNSLSGLVIKRRLIDYFRQSGKESDIPDSDNLAEKAAFEEDWERSERETEIERFGQILSDFNLSFELVAENQPRHRQTRERLRRAALVLAGDRDLLEHLYSSGNLPKGRLCELAGVTPRMLDRGRAYVIALALLLSKDDLPHLQAYAQDLAGRGDN
jgi:RNA polymerase sigma factor